MSGPISTTEVGLSLLTIVVGGGTACQATINWEVAEHFALRLFSAFLNLFSGLLLLTVLCSLESLLLSKPFLKWKRRPSLHHLLPGVCGLCYVLGTVFLLSQLGPSLFMVLVVAGQLLCAASLDHFGIGRSEPKRLTPLRMFALAAAVGGAALSVSKTLLQAQDTTPTWVRALSALGAFGVGCIMVWQALLSRYAAEILHSRLAATWWSFAVSASLSGLCLLLNYLFASDDSLARFSRRSTWDSSSWWMYTAALFGVAYIASSIYIPPQTSSQAYFVCLVAGQLTFSGLIDHYGFFGRQAKPIAVQDVCGVAIVLLAAVLMQLPAELCGQLPSLPSLLPAKPEVAPYLELNLQERLVGERELPTLE
jgi:transporter family-2 protein